MKWMQASPTLAVRGIKNRPFEQESVVTVEVFERIRASAIVLEYSSHHPFPPPYIPNISPYQITMISKVVCQSGKIKKTR